MPIGESSSADKVEAVETSRSPLDVKNPSSEKEAIDGHTDIAVVGSSEIDDVLHGPNGEEYPNKHELETLRRVKGHIPWIVYTIAFIELCERFAYYGTTAVFTNFIQQPLPPGSTTGSAGTYGQPGALGQGQQASTGLITFNTFWAYLMPLVGGYLSDTYWGKYKTIHAGIVMATIGHILIIVSAIPAMIKNPSGALGVFSLGLIFFGIGVGFFKANISPMIAEQYEAGHPRATIKVLKSGERVIQDPVATIAVIYMRYYFFINVGSLTGQISMVYAEKYVGFWLSFTLPTILFVLSPMVLIAFNKKYVKNPPTGSVIGKFFSMLRLGMKGRWSANPVRLYHSITEPGFFERIKPSNIPEAQRPAWMTFDDSWVDQVRRGVKACQVFLLFPIYWLPYSQLNSNLISQAATLELNGVPNDIINNLDPIALLIFIPLFDKFFYPALRRVNINLTPIKKITIGFAFGTVAMVVAAIIQHYIYMKSPCRPISGYGYVADCKSVILAERGLPEDSPLPESEYKPDLTVWVQAPAYITIAFSEIFASITGLEYAFTKAPKNMRGFITGVFWFAQAFSAALGQAFVPMALDPLLVWLYTTLAIIAALAGTAFWVAFRKLDTEEDALNALPDSVFKGKRNQDQDFAELEKRHREQERIREAQGLDEKPGAS
ncbi:POT family protein [Xylariomycetidae sp. FL0641]|nr:POT family protein [Xylariomycetidae sp. FL0641]